MASKIHGLLVFTWSGNRRSEWDFIAYLYLYLYLENGCNLQIFNKLNNLSFLTTGFGQQTIFDLLANINTSSKIVGFKVRNNMRVIQYWYDFSSVIISSSSWKFTIIKIIFAYISKYFFSIFTDQISHQDVREQTKNTIHFIRLHAPWPLLCRYAEELNLRAPIQVRQFFSQTKSMLKEIFYIYKLITVFSQNQQLDLSFLHNFDQYSIKLWNLFIIYPTLW